MCYQCSRCNQCGKFSYKTVIRCKTCDNEVPIGASTCPGCGAPTTGNIYAGDMVYDPSVPVRKNHRDG